jgi:ABC-2 type transport system ATP-binding protein
MIPPASCLVHPHPADTSRRHEVRRGCEDGRVLTAEGPVGDGHVAVDGVIRTSQLTKIYPGADVAAVDKLDLVVRSGEIFGLLGPNGAGKTTTVGMLTTRVIPTSGQALLGEIDVVAQPTLVKQLIGVASQENTLDRQLTVWENL